MHSMRTSCQKFRRSGCQLALTSKIVNRSWLSPIKKIREKLYWVCVLSQEPRQEIVTDAWSTVSGVDSTSISIDVRKCISSPIWRFNLSLFGLHETELWFWVAVAYCQKKIPSLNVQFAWKWLSFGVSLELSPTIVASLYQWRRLMFRLYNRQGIRWL